MAPEVAIIGLGMMGGSLAGALAAAGVRVAGTGRNAHALEEARSRGWVSRVAEDPADAVSGADLVVLGVPVGAAGEVLEACRHALKPGAVVTDLGSTKVEVERNCEPIVTGAGGCFIGSHPICGSEKTGLAEARPDMYRGATVVVCPPDGTPAAALRTLSDFWVSVGSHPYVLNAAEHDRILALTSHLPHLLSSLLTRAVLSRHDLPLLRELCGSGFRDMSRLAEGSPVMWRDILLTNSGAIINELQRTQLLISELTAVVEQGDPEAIQKWLEISRQFRLDWTGEKEDNGPD